MQLHELDAAIATLRRLNNSSRALLFKGNKRRDERAELKAWIDQNNLRIQQLEKQRQFRALHAV
jgi:hypothetical protein